MIKIEIEDLGKKFSAEWIFRHLSYTFDPIQPTVVLGSNGSGKSTLLKSLASMIPQNEGHILYTIDDQKIPDDEIHSHISFVGPYVELIEEFTLTEFLYFHSKFRSFDVNYTVSDIINLCGLRDHKDKMIRNFSSGMKQKIKLGISFYEKSKILFLDEPCANLDQKNVEWYQQEILKLHTKKTIIIGSNEPKEYIFCKNQLNIVNFKS
ncbi:MAG: ABC transporter ATP-binding protein [Leadbetterella sp.]